MHPLTYLHLRMQLEGISLSGDRLERDPSAGPDGSLPLVLLARLSTRELVTYYGLSLPSGAYKKLSTSFHGPGFPAVASLLHALELDKEQASVDHSFTYILLNHSAGLDQEVGRYSGNHPQVTSIGYHGQAEHVFGIETEGRVVSACVSARENEHCGEAWVFTDPRHRRQGLASKVMRAWANSLISVGKIPFYTHEAGSKASAGLARRLGLQPVFEGLRISRLPA